MFMLGICSVCNHWRGGACEAFEWKCFDSSLQTCHNVPKPAWKWPNAAVNTIPTHALTAWITKPSTIMVLAAAFDLFWSWFWQVISVGGLACGGHNSYCIHTHLKVLVSSNAFMASYSFICGYCGTFFHDVESLYRINSSLPGQNGRHFGRQHFQMHFLKWKCMNFAEDFTKICPN